MTQWMLTSYKYPKEHRKAIHFPFDTLTIICPYSDHTVVIILSIFRIEFVALWSLKSCSIIKKNFPLFFDQTFETERQKPL